MNSLQTFKSITRPALMKLLGQKNIHQAPAINKIVVAMGIGSLATRKGVKDFSDLEKNMATITGQKPQTIKSKKSVSNFKLREGMPVMLRVTLRWEKAYDFIYRLVHITLPRVRDFMWINPKSFDKTWNFTIWLKDQSVFSEIPVDQITTTMGVQITLVPNSSSSEHNKKLLESLGFIFVNHSK